MNRGSVYYLVPFCINENLPDIKSKKMIFKFFRSLYSI